MLRSLAFLILVFLSVAGPSPYSRAKAQTRAELSDEEYAVYSAVLKQKYVYKTMIIIDQTEMTPFVLQGLEVEHIPRMLSPSSPSTLDDFKSRNKEPRVLRESFNLNFRYILLKGTVLREFFKDDAIKGWEEFYKINPGSDGYIRLSRVGFSTEGVEALVYIEHGCGATCGTGTFLLLKKREKGWKVERKALLWIS